MNNFDPKKQGYIFNIQHYSVHDGPGIRTIVFLKGCPLRCKWCSNPESQHSQPELAFNSNKCIGLAECARCIKACPQSALEENGKIIKINRQSCQDCFNCAAVCPSQALNIFGKLMSVSEVMKAVEADSVFYSRSGGGITLSGGEPLLQSDFACELLKEAKRRRINTAIETCGYADWATLEKVGNYLDSILFDIKSFDNKKHMQFTGVSNERILDNFTKLCKAFPKMTKLVRTPIIPGFNDSVDDIKAIVNFIKDIPNVKYELLSYHQLGQPKYQYLGREYPLADLKTDDEKMRELKQIAKMPFKEEHNEHH